MPTRQSERLRMKRSRVQGQRIPSTGVREDRSWNRRKRQNPIDPSELDRFFGHAKYHARGLVLRDIRCTAVL